MGAMMTDTKRFPYLRGLTMLGATLALAACGGSDSDDDSVALDSVVGQYSGVYQDADGQPNLATVTLIGNDNLTFVGLDEQDRRTEYSGTFDSGSGAVSFAGADCDTGGDHLTCDIDGVSVRLDVVNDATAPAVSDLAGDYQLRIDGALYPLTLASDGQFSLAANGCETAGTVSPALHGQVLAVAITGDDCGGSLARGYLEAEPLYTDDDALAVYLPASDLSGYWIR